LGTYPPRECGIATFNQDLLTSTQKLLGSDIACKAAALNFSPLSLYIYPPEVEWKINQNSKRDYIDLAKKFNDEPLIRGIVIQHEYGIFGGKDGKNILYFTNTLKKPFIVTLHTVLPDQKSHMARVTSEIVRRANKLVVLTQRSKEILEDVHPHSMGKIKVIAHGIHDTPFSTTQIPKRKLNLEENIVLSTFGLLSPGKGLQYVIKALPAVVKKYPSLRYLVLGQTHPLVRRIDGEKYREKLQQLVIKLKLEKHVKFYDEYLDLADLLEYLKATDIYISSSINPNQAVSGTLSYALGTGRAVISTEFTQAREIITEKNGRLVPIKNPKAITLALLSLLENKDDLPNMHMQAYKSTRHMLWGNVAQEYISLLHIMPAINLAHLLKMTDDFGLFQFAKYDKPNKEYGYTLDDNARALIVCSMLIGLVQQSKMPNLETYLNFIKKCQLPDGTFINYIDHSHKVMTIQNQKENLEDATARAMWALSEVMKNKLVDSNSRNLAKEMFVRALPHTKKFHHIRSTGLIVKAFANAIQAYPGLRDKLLAEIKINADFLVTEFEKNSIKTWRWFDTYLAYSNAIVPESLLIAGHVTNNSHYTDTGIAALTFLIQKTFSESRYIPIGHSHWYKKDSTRSHFDQQPEDPASMILALATALKITHDEKYRDLINICFSWFLGNNSLGVPLYNYKTGGCYDGLHPDRVNLNQGGESLVSYLLVRLAMAKLDNNENSTNKKYLP